MISDIFASAGYLLAFVVCAAWVTIAIIQAANRRYVIFWLAVAMAAATAGGSFMLMGIYAGWRVVPYTNTIAITRVGFAMAALAAAIFTISYLATMWRRGHPSEPID